jgi:hypothetical protein
MKINPKIRIALILLSVYGLYQFNNYWNTDTLCTADTVVGRTQSNVPSYSRLSSVSEWDTFACRIDQAVYKKTGQHLWEYYTKDGKLFGGQWKNMLIEHFFYESTGRNPIRKPLSLFKKILWKQQRCFDIYTDYNLVEIIETIENPIKHYQDVLLDTNYRPNTYDKFGNHLCNIYGVNLECRISIYGVHKALDTLFVTSYAELWTPHNFQLGKNPFGKLSPDERKVLFGNN